MEKAENDMVPSILHPTLFLAKMLAREGSFPVKYLDGFQRLIDDALDALQDTQITESQKEDVKQAVLDIIYDARTKAGME